MKDDIENYEPKTPQVEQIAGRRVIAWIGDASGAVGSTLWIADTPARITRILEGRRVEAIVFDPRGIAAEAPVRHSTTMAAWPAPRPGITALTALDFEPDGAVVEHVEREREAISTGIESIDDWTPLARFGTNVVVDFGATTALFDTLVKRAAAGSLVAATHLPHELEADFHIRWDAPDDAALARKVAVHWARTLRDATLILDADVHTRLDRLTDEAAGITIFVRVAMEPDLEIIAETLDLGTADAQLVLRDDGTIDFARSTSRLGDEPHAELFSRIAELKEQRALFGDDEMEPEDFELLARAELAERALIR